MLKLFKKFKIHENILLKNVKFHSFMHSLSQRASQQRPSHYKHIKIDVTNCWNDWCNDDDEKRKEFLNKKILSFNNFL